MNPAKVAQQARLSLFTPQMAATAAWQQQLCALWPHDPGVSGWCTATSRSCSSTAAPTR